GDRPAGPSRGGRRSGPGMGPVRPASRVRLGRRRHRALPCRSHSFEAEMAEIRTLISAEEIDVALERMGEQISADYRGKSLLVVGVLKGAFMVMADLARKIDIPVEFDFMAVSS